MTYVIEKGVPLPTKAKVLTDERASVRKLEVGDSFAVPADREHAARQAASDEAKGGLSFTARKQPDGTIRVWRLA